MTYMPEKIYAVPYDGFDHGEWDECERKAKYEYEYIRADLVRDSLEKLMFDLEKDPYLSRKIMANFGEEIQDLLNRF